MPKVRSSFDAIGLRFYDASERKLIVEKAPEVEQQDLKAGKTVSE